MLDTDIRKRNNSSMTYNEYIDVYEVAPRKPIHRPTEISMDDITDLSLDGSPSRQKSKSPKKNNKFFGTSHHDIITLNTIVEKDEISEYNSPCSLSSNQKDCSPNIQNKAYSLRTEIRKRSRSENINFTCLNFMERRIMRKMQIEHSIQAQQQQQI